MGCLAFYVRKIIMEWPAISSDLNPIEYKQKKERLKSVSHFLSFFVVNGRKKALNAK